MWQLLDLEGTASNEEKMVCPVINHGSTRAVFLSFPSDAIPLDSLHCGTFQLNALKPTDT